MDDSQRTYYADLQALAVEREALIRGALYQLQVDARDVAVMWLICRELIEAAGTMFPPTVKDIGDRIGCSAETVKRRLGRLVKFGIVRVERDETASARDPKRRTIDWDRTARLARREVPMLPTRVAPLGQGDPTGSSSGQGDPTRPVETQRELPGGSLFLDIYPPTPLELKKPSEAAGGAVLKLPEPEAAGVAKPQAATGTATAGPTEPAGPAIAASAGPSWVDVEASVAACGVGGAAAACRSARGRGVTPIEVLRLVEIFRGESGVGPGVLYQRICRHVAGSVVAGFAPSAEPIEAKERRIAERLTIGAAAREQLAEHAADVEAERRELAELEAEHGAAIDEAAIDELVQALQRTGRGCFVAALRRPGGRDSPTIRPDLLAAWAEVRSLAEA